jgi:hypothetical protein
LGAACHLYLWVVSIHGKFGKVAEESLHPVEERLAGFSQTFQRTRRNDEISLKLELEDSQRKDALRPQSTLEKRDEDLFSQACEEIRQPRLLPREKRLLAKKRRKGMKLDNDACQKLMKYRLRHEKEEEQRIVFFVHFHKAGGTSMVHKFREGGYQFWNREENGNPFGSGKGINGATGAALKFWRYSRSQFEAFLEDARSQGKGGAEFIAAEWNFFTSDHFFEKDYFRKEAKIDLITVLRDPYDRFLSNFNFKLDNFDAFNPRISNPLEWAHLDLIRRKGKFKPFRKPVGKSTTVDSPSYQYGEQVPHDSYFSVNYNKPNYYTAFLNGLTENTDDPGYDSAPFDFEYFAFGLNQTHLDIAKERLTNLFDAVLVLERPETHAQLDRWFAFSGKPNGGRLPQRNKNRKKKKNDGGGEFTREEFYKYNALDKELYDYAVELSLSRSGGKQTTNSNQQ